MIPWERDIYTSLLKQHIEEQNLKNQQQEGPKVWMNKVKK